MLCNQTRPYFTGIVVLRTLVLVLRPVLRPLFDLVVVALWRHKKKKNQVLFWHGLGQRGLPSLEWPRLVYLLDEKPVALMSLDWIECSLSSHPVYQTRLNPLKVLSLPHYSLVLGLMRFWLQHRLHSRSIRFSKWLIILWEVVRYKL